jgi:hypothetical protein
MVTAGQSVQFVARRQLCVLSLEAATVQECEALRLRMLDSATHQALRRALNANAVTGSPLSCILVSRVISLGDSSVVAVGTSRVAGDSVFNSSQQVWVWFRNTRGQGLTWMAAPPNQTFSTIAAIHTQEECG